jgi:transcriptional regulator with XRE-family HTH domain|tara:strand:+ start:200 stop:631 length:432 start_codon:yes stop_codon:yes gene_type:complete
MERRYKMSRRGRRNWSNLEINKRICKQLILHRVWNELSQKNLAKDIGATYQQYQKVEKCYNRIFAEQLISICNNRKWDISIFNADPYETLKEWFKRDYGDSLTRPDKYNKIIRFWDVLDKSAQRNYYGEEPIPFVVDSIQKGN